MRNQVKKVVGDSKSRDQFFTVFTTENTQEIEMFSNLWNEALRFEPTATVSSFQYFTQDVRIGDINMRAGDIFVVHIKGIHRNPNEW